ncbi:RDD family protein [candidate division KSB1 bacterium]|nr:RDD family protein [candidate division KSB1 bacterium]
MIGEIGQSEIMQRMAVARSLTVPVNPSLIVIDMLAANQGFVPVVSQSLETELIPSFSGWYQVSDEALKSMRDLASAENGLDEIQNTTDISFGSQQALVDSVSKITMKLQGAGLEVYRGKDEVLAALTSLLYFEPPKPVETEEPVEEVKKSRKKEPKLTPEEVEALKEQELAAEKAKEDARIQAIEQAKEKAKADAKAWAPLVQKYSSYATFPWIISLLNFVLAIIAGIVSFYYYIFYSTAEDGQTNGMRIAKIELYRNDGKELSSMGGLGGVGLVPALIMTVAYLIFSPIFFIFTYMQINLLFLEKSFLTLRILPDFLQGKGLLLAAFHTLDAVFTGDINVFLGLLLTIGLLLLSILVFLLLAFIFGLIFHVIWFLAGIIAGVVGKDEPEKEIALQ